MKRLIAAAISAAMLMGCLPVYAKNLTAVTQSENVSDVSSDNLKGVLNTAKELLDIPDSYDDMEYSIQGENVDVYWRNSAAEDYINVSITLDGKLKSYYLSNSNYNRSTGIPKYNNEQAEKTANAFAVKVLGDDFKSCVLYNTVFNNGNEFDFYYRQYFNNAVVRGATVSVSVNKYTGEIQSLHSSLEDIKKLEKQDRVIGEAAAKEKYLENIGIKPEYRFFYDSETKSRNALPVYIINDGNRYVDAVTGDILVLNYRDVFDDNYDYAEEAVEEDGAAKGAGYSRLSEEEIKKADEIQGLIGVDKAVSNIKENFSYAKKLKLTSYNLTKNQYSYYARKSQADSQDYYYYLYFDEGFAIVNAKSGEIISFDCYTYDEENKEIKITFDDAVKKSDELIDKIAPAFKSSIRLNQEQGKEVNIYGCSISYDRLYEGVPCRGDGIFLDFDAKGEITSYRKKWTDADFVSAKNLITEEQAFDLLDKQFNFDLTYIYTGEQYRLVYDFTGDSAYSIIDGITGEFLDYSGKPVSTEKNGRYKDISDHWCKDAVEALALLGIYLDGEYFRPDEPITEKDFIKLISNISYIYRDEETENTVTRYKAAEYIAEVLCGEKILGKNDAFVQPFEDVDEEHYAAVAICKSFGVVSGNKGAFHGEETITRAEAAQMVYNYFLNED